ncbi:hypothetical protein TNCT_513901 [Trichonephila clavata]|uniref:Uncharacterized protein n=1 Tax=Trichonephila clavata TaxID=2740835 RepID=A0A8X6H2L0_TRICU|nr:hypothetical protein TNCT_513901 [Trichonephila clavata]
MENNIPAPTLGDISVKELLWRTMEIDTDGFPLQQHTVQTDENMIRIADSNAPSVQFLGPIFSNSIECTECWRFIASSQSESHSFMNTTREILPFNLKSILYPQ